ncbi:glycine cleavage system protein GcvH [Gammaproteobacteria bacterium]|nr:glycine cleavage system protein GcvH [Gammaproteobacteria bacterium]
MQNKKYTDEHEWISIDGEIGTVGISVYAQVQLGDVVFIEVPEIGTVYQKGEEAAVVESVKAASEVYAPVDGEIVEVNNGLEEDPSIVNSDAEGRGWFYKIKVNNLSDLDGLMDGEAYKLFIEAMT